MWQSTESPNYELLQNPIFLFQFIEKIKYTREQNKLFMQLYGKIRWSYSLPINLGIILERGSAIDKCTLKECRCDISGQLEKSG